MKEIEDELSLVPPLQLLTHLADYNADNRCANMHAYTSPVALVILT